MVMNRSFFSKLLVILTSFAVYTKAYAGALPNPDINVETGVNKDFKIITNGEMLSIEAGGSIDKLKGLDGKDLVIDKNSLASEGFFETKVPAGDKEFPGVMERTTAMTTDENLIADKNIAAINLIHNVDVSGAGHSIVETTGDKKLTFTGGLFSIANKIDATNGILNHIGNEQLTIEGSGLASMFNESSDPNNGFLYRSGKTFYSLGEKFISYMDRAAYGIIANGYTSAGADNNVAVRIGNTGAGAGAKSIIIEGSEFTTGRGDGAFIKLEGGAKDKKVMLKTRDANSTLTIKDSTMDYFVRNASWLGVGGSKFKVENSTFNKAFFASSDDYHGAISIYFQEGLNISGGKFNNDNVFILGADQPENGNQYDAAAVNIRGSYIINHSSQSVGEKAGTFLIKNRKNINFILNNGGEFTIASPDGVNNVSIIFAVDKDVLSNDASQIVVKFQGNNSKVSIGEIELKKIDGGVYHDLVDNDINAAGGLKVVVNENVKFAPRGDLIAHEIEFKPNSIYEIKADETGIIAGEIKLMKGLAGGTKGKIKIGNAASAAKLNLVYTSDILNVVVGTKEYDLYDSAAFDIDANSHADGFKIGVNGNYDGSIYYATKFTKADGKLKITAHTAKDIKFTPVNILPNRIDYKFFADIDNAGEAEIRDYADNEVIFTIDNYFKPITVHLSDSIYAKEKRKEKLTADKEFSYAIMVNRADGTDGGDSDIITLSDAHKATFSNDFIAIGNKIANKKSIISHEGELVIGGKGKTVAFIRNDGTDIANLDENTLIKSGGNTTILGENIIFDGNKVSRGIESGGNVQIGYGTGHLIINDSIFNDNNFALSGFIYSTKDNNEIIIDVTDINISGLLENFNFNNDKTSKLELKAKDIISIKGNDKQIVFQTNVNGDGILIESNIFAVHNIKNDNNDVFSSGTNLDINVNYLTLDNIDTGNNGILFDADKKLKLRVVEDLLFYNSSNKTTKGSIFRVTEPNEGEFDIGINNFILNKEVKIEAALFLSENGNDPDKIDKIIINNFNVYGENTSGTTIHNIYKMAGFKKVEFGSINSNTLIKEVHFKTPFFIGKKSPKVANIYDTAPVHINGGFNITDSTIDEEGFFTINNRKEIIFNSNKDVYISNNDKIALVIGVDGGVLSRATEMAVIQLTGTATYSFNGITLMKISGVNYEGLAADGSEVSATGGLKLTIDNGITYELLNNSEHRVNEVNFVRGSKLLLRVNADGTGNNGKFVSLKRKTAAGAFENAKVTGEVKFAVDVAGGKLTTDRTISLNIFNDFDMAGITIPSFDKYYKYKLEFDNINGTISVTNKTAEQAVKDAKEAVDKTDISSNSKETIIAFTHDDYDNYIAEYFNNLVLNAEKAKIESGVRAINPIEEISLASAVGEVASNVVHTATNYVSINRLSPRNNSKIASNYVLVADNGANLSEHKFIEGDPWEFWAKYLFNFGSLETKGSKTKTNGNGFIVGVDKGFFSNKVKAGFAFMPNWDELKNNEREIKVMSLAFSVYSRTNLYKFSNSNEIYINNTIGYVHSFNKDTPIGISKKLNLEESEYSGNAFTLDGIAGYRFDNLELSTEFGLKYTYLNQSEYKNSVGNKVSGLNRNVLTMILGVKYDIPEDSLLDNLSATIAFDIDYDIMSIGNDKYTITTPKREVKYIVSDSNKTNRFGTNINFDFNYEVIDNLKLSLGYGIRLASKFINNTLSFGVRYSW